MAGGGCCQLVGNLTLGIDGCIISVSTNSSSEVAAVCGDEPLEGPVTHSVSISGYASNELWRGCPGKAGVNIPYIRKYDCVNNILYFIFAGQGQSFTSGPVGSFVSLYKAFSSVSSFSASASSGPSSIYMETTQTNGYGLLYSGGPISFSTSELSNTIDLGGSLGGGHYLQSFSFDAQPGQLPIASYNFVAPMQGG
jgi:hypothetical protein